MEIDWNEEHTCSGDLTYIGAIPVGVWKSILKYCQDAMKHMERREDREHMKNICKTLREKWKVIEKFARVKPEIIQRSIAAQLDKYKDTLKKRHEASEEKVLLEEEVNLIEEAPDEELPTRESDGVDTGVDDQQQENKAAPKRTEHLLECIGMRCRLTNHHKQFKSTQVGNRAGPKKCGTCQQFETAIKKVLAIEAYIVDQLEEPNDDIFVI
jgi:hypothetical protein